jgi:hypothetical protein
MFCHLRVATAVRLGSALVTGITVRVVGALASLDGAVVAAVLRVVAPAAVREDFFLVFATVVVFFVVGCGLDAVATTTIAGGRDFASRAAT